MKEIYHREAIYEFNRPIKLKDLWIWWRWFYFNSKKINKTNVEDEIEIEKDIMYHIP